MMFSIYQKTIEHKITFSGVGLHSGKNSNVKFIPAHDNQGIVFKRVDLENNNLIEAKFNNVSSATLCTSLKNNHGVKVSTVEHLLAALYIKGIDNLVVDYKEDLKRETDKQIKKNLQNVISFGHKDLQKILEKSHKDFFKKFHIEYKRIDSARNKILDYCSTNKRLAKKQSYWPLELLDFAENLEENTIPKKEKKAK